MKLQQGQIWKAGEEFLRIVELHRLEVKYKAMRDLATREGTHHHVTKKQFCRLIKNAALVEPSAAEGVDVPSEPSIAADESAIS
jgi:hypothetical protein